MLTEHNQGTNKISEICKPKTTLQHRVQAKKKLRFSYLFFNKDGTLIDNRYLHKTLYEKLQDLVKTQKINLQDLDSSQTFQFFYDQDTFEYTPVDEPTQIVFGVEPFLTKPINKAYSTVAK